MQQPAFDHATVYAGMSDSELLAIAKDAESLTAEALAALRKEISKRSLGQAAPEEDLAVDYHRNLRDQLVSKLNTSQMMFLLPRWNGAEAEEDLRVLLRNQPIGGWTAVFASQMIIGGLLALVIMVRMLRLDTDYTPVSRFLLAWTPMSVALNLLYLSAGIALWKKWRFAVKLAKAAIAACVLNAVIVLAGLTLIGFVNRPPASVLAGVHGPWLAPDVQSLLGRVLPLSAAGVFFGIVGWLYLARSRRVRLTYPDDSTAPGSPSFLG